MVNRYSPRFRGKQLIPMIAEITVMLGLAAVIFGCGLAYMPTPPPVAPNMVTSYKKYPSINLVNTQGASTIIDLSAGPYTLKADLHAYTEAVRALIEQVWRTKGGTVSKDAHHILELAVVDVWLIPRFGVFKCDVNLQVALGESAPFGLEASAQNFSYEKAIDSALSESVVAILNRQEVVAYLRD